MTDEETVRFTRNMLIMALVTIVLDIVFDSIGLFLGIAITLWGNYTVSLGVVPIILGFAIMILYCVLVLRRVEREVHVT